MLSKINLFFLGLLMMSCSASSYVNRASRLLDKAKRLDPSIEHVSVDSVKQEVIVPGDTIVIDLPAEVIEELLNTPVDTAPSLALPVKNKPPKKKLWVSQVLTSADGVKVEIIRTENGLKVKVLTPPDTITVYKIRERTIYKTTATYKEFIKQWWGINNFQFWLIHVALILGTLLAVYLKIIIPRFPNLRI